MDGLQTVEILLVEDNPRDAEMTLRAMRKHNLANGVHWVKDGQAALDYVFCEGEYTGRSEHAVPRLILLDIRMPKVDGIEVLRRIKAAERTRAIPVVVMTSSNEERDVMESYRLGVNSYIVKPIAFDAFMETVSRIGLYWAILNRVPP